MNGPKFLIIDNDILFAAVAADSCHGWINMRRGLIVLRRACSHACVSDQVLHLAVEQSVKIASIDPSTDTP